MSDRRLLVARAALLAGCATGGRPAGGGGPAFDVVLRGGTVYDGGGAARRSSATSRSPANGVAAVDTGTQVLRDGEHTGAAPGRVVRGPGWTGWRALPSDDTPRR